MAEANPFCCPKAQLKFQGDKMFKILSRPQINLEDMMKLDEVAHENAHRTTLLSR
jgi:tRNA uridine 5-carboxymethylaminomethyl modification enzyme